MMYITIGKNKKRYNPEEWQFNAYQFLNIYIEDENMIGKPFCRKHDGKIDLSNTDKYGRRLNYWLLSYNDYIKPTSGDVFIGYYTKIGTKVERKEEKIVLLPSILSQEELVGMAQNIGDIVFNCHSFTRATFSQQTNQGINNNGDIRGANLQKQGGYSDYILSQLPCFFDTLEKNIAIIKKNPIFSMQAIKKEIDIAKSNKPKDFLTRKTKPDKKRTLSYGKSYDEYGLENKWLGYLIFEILPKILGKDSLLANFEEYKNNNALDNIENTNNDSLKNKIDSIEKRLLAIQSDEFIKKFDLRLKAQPIITTRLIKTRGYSEILRAYQEIFNENFLKAFQFYNDIIGAYTSGYMDNLSNIYEHWCLVVLYDNLLKLGFKPDDNCRLENIIKLQDDNLIIPSGSLIVLRKPFAQYDYSNNFYDNRGDIVIKLYYEPKLFFNYQAMLQDSQNYYDYLTPDIFIEIEAPNRAFGLNNFSIILDAKFKKYDNYDLERQLREGYQLKDIKYFQDIMHTAMWKYHFILHDFFVRNEHNQKPRVGMSCILSPNIDFLWQGEKPLIECEFLQNNRRQVEQLFMNFNALNNNDYRGLVSHKFGTLTLRQKYLGRDIRRLFAIIFYYHMGLTSLCLNCGRELHEESEFYVNDYDNITNPMTKSEQLLRQRNDELWGYIDNAWSNTDPTTRFRACCQECQTQWRVSFCNSGNYHARRPNVNNRMIKLGIDDKNGYIPIHYKTRYETHEETYDGTHCPKCFAMKKSNIATKFYDDESPF